METTTETPELTARENAGNDARVERRLATILLAGVTLPEAADLPATLAARRRDIIDPKFREHRGRVLQTTGTGMLVEFSSVVDAVRCAVDIQRAMTDRNAGMGQPLELRMGLNVGDILVDDGEVFGEGINLAARLEAMAEPGGILVSRTVRDHLSERLDFHVDDLGTHRPKSASRPIAVYRVRYREESGAKPVWWRHGPTQLKALGAIAAIAAIGAAGYLVYRTAWFREPPVAELCRTGQAVEALWRGAWYPAIAMAPPTDTGRCHVRYVGYSAEDDGLMPLDRLRMPLPPTDNLAQTCQPGRRVEVLSEGAWYHAQVKGQGNIPALCSIHYTGYGDDDDEEVPGDRIRDVP